MKEEELNDLKYRELQKLAKENGVKANLPKSALIEALLEAFGAKKDSTESEAEESKNQSDLTSQKEIVNIPTDSTDPGCEMRKDAPNSRRNSRKKGSDHGSKIQSEQPSQVEIPDIPADADSEMKENVPNSRRNSRKKSSDPVSTNSRDKSIGKKSFDQKALDAEIAQVEQMANDIMDGLAPRVRSTRNSSSVEAASAQIDRTETPVDEKNKSIQVSRRNSRISRLFDKEAFDVEAAKVSRFAQEIVNSPRKRSSILNLTPVMKGATASAVNSPLVLEKNRQGLITPSQKRPSSETTPKLIDAKKRKVEITKPTPGSVTKASLLTPSQKRPSTEMTPKLTDAKKRKVEITKPTPGSVTKPKEKITGIPRPKVRKVPDFAKLHAKQFGKMDNLDQYLGKKKERMAGLTPGPKSQVKSSATTAR